MLYRTYGSRATLLTNRVLSYPLHSFVHLATHEALHVHRAQNKRKIPYALEEALAEFIASNGIVQFCEKYATHALSAAKSYRDVTENIARAINNLVDMVHKENHFDMHSHKPYSNLCKHIEDLVKRARNTCLRDRFEFKVNNAFLIRYRDYYKFYFLIQEIYNKRKNNDIGKFIQWLFDRSCGKSEEEVFSMLTKFSKVDRFGATY